MNILKLISNNFISAVVNNLNWLYRASKIKSGKNLNIKFPFEVEGKGKIKLGDYVRIGRGVKMKCSLNCSISFGHSVRIGSNVEVSATNNSSLNIGNNSSIGAGSTCMSHNNWSIGNHVSIETFCQIFSREKGAIGKFFVSDNSSIGDFSLIDLSGDVIIGETVAIGPRCIIYTHDHDYMEENIVAPWKGKAKVQNVVVGNNSWIGSNVTILPGVVIGEGAIVAAGSIVTKSIPERTLWAGIPARQIKTL